MNTRILLVEDDENLGFVVSDQLTEHGYFIDWAKDGNEARKLFNTNSYHLCLLDVMLPKVDGFELAEEFVHDKPNTPILFVTAKSLKDDKIKGLKLGADDYITKPFDMDELVLRIEVALRRRNNFTVPSSGTLKVGSYSFFPTENRLELNHHIVKLTKKESELLHLLVQRKNSVLERNEALKLIWGDNTYYNGRSMDVFITKLRKHLHLDANIQIENIHGVGFKLTDGVN